jgi:hypothetical protein
MPIQQYKQMRTKYILYFIIFNSLIFLLQSCGIYSFTGASIPPEVKTISIQYFSNNAPLVQPTLSQSFTDALKDKFTNQTNLTLVNRAGDLNIQGSVTNYSVSPVAIQSSDMAALNRLTISVSVKFTNNIDEKQNFETIFSRYADYSSSESLSSVEESLIKQINDELVEDIFNKSVVNW